MRDERVSPHWVPRPGRSAGASDFAARESLSRPRGAAPAAGGAGGGGGGDVSAAVPWAP
jgi:hypothetical protein